MKALIIAFAMIMVLPFAFGDEMGTVQMQDIPPKEDNSNDPSGISFTTQTTTQTHSGGGRTIITPPIKLSPKLIYALDQLHYYEQVCKDVRAGSINWIVAIGYINQYNQEITELQKSEG